MFLYSKNVFLYFLIVYIRLIVNYAFRLKSLNRYNSGFFPKFAKKSKNLIVFKRLLFSANYIINSSKT